MKFLTKLVSYTHTGRRIEIFNPEAFDQILEPIKLKGSKNELIHRELKREVKKEVKTRKNPVQRLKILQTTDKVPTKLVIEEPAVSEQLARFVELPGAPLPIGKSAYVLDSYGGNLDLKTELKNFIELFIEQTRSSQIFLKLEIRSKEQYPQFKILFQLYQKILKKDSTQIEKFLTAQGLEPSWIRQIVPELIKLSFSTSENEIKNTLALLEIENEKYKKTLQILLHQAVHSFANRFPIKDQQKKQKITFTVGLLSATALGYLIKPDLNLLLMTPLWSAFTMGWRLMKDRLIRGKDNLQVMEAIKANNWSLFSIAPQFAAAWITQKILLLFSFSIQTQGFIVAIAMAFTYTGWAYLQDWWYDKNRGRFRLANAARGIVGLIFTIPFLSLPAAVRDTTMVIVKKVARDLWSFFIESTHQLNHIKNNNLKRFEKFKTKILEQDIDTEKWFGLMIHVYGLWINEPQVKRHFREWLMSDRNSQRLINHFKKLISLRNGELTQMLEGRSRKEEQIVKQYYQHLDPFTEWIQSLEQHPKENFRQKLVKHILSIQGSGLIYFGTQQLLDRLLIDSAYLQITTYLVAIQNWWPALTASLQISLAPWALAALSYPMIYLLSKQISRKI